LVPNVIVYIVSLAGSQIYSAIIATEHVHTSVSETKSRREKASLDLHGSSVLEMALLVEEGISFAEVVI